MIEKDIVSAPIFIKLIDTRHLYPQDQIEYPNIMVEPSPSHYPQFINSPTKKQPLCTTSDDTDLVEPTPCFLVEIFCCCK